MRRLDDDLYEDDYGDGRVEPEFDHAVLHRRAGRGRRSGPTATDYLQTEPEGQLSPGDIIARAAASVPENLDPDSEKNSLLPDPEGWSEQISHLPPRPRRPLHQRLPVPRLPRWSPDLSRLKRYAAGILVIGGVGWLLSADILTKGANWVSGVVDSSISSANAGLTVRLAEIRVDGRRHTPRKDLEQALRIREGDDLMNVDLSAARQRIEQLPWVASAAVERRLSGVISIQLREHRALARLKTGNTISLISATGRPIAVRPGGQFASLILISGAGAAAQAPALIRLLGRNPGLARRVAEARRLGQRRWDLVFRNGALLRLPAGFAPAAWAKFAELDRRHRLLARGRALFDMRLPDRMIIRPGHGAESVTGPNAERIARRDLTRTAPAAGRRTEPARHGVRPLLSPAKRRRMARLKRRGGRR